jgi:ABC-type sugar transport system substrate-binding protein
MRILSASTVAGSLLLAALVGTLSATGLSAQSASSVRVASVSTADRETYVQQAREEMQQWQLKLKDFSDKTRTKATDANIAAQKDFNEAWAEADVASQKLETAGAADWESAKSSFKKASQKLAAVWQKIIILVR